MELLIYVGGPLAVFVAALVSAKLSPWLVTRYPALRITTEAGRFRYAAQTASLYVLIFCAGFFLAVFALMPSLFFPHTNYGNQGEGEAFAVLIMLFTAGLPQLLVFIGVWLHAWKKSAGLLQPGAPARFPEAGAGIVLALIALGGSLFFFSLSARLYLLLAAPFVRF